MATENGKIEIIKLLLLRPDLDINEKTIIILLVLYHFNYQSFISFQNSKIFITFKFQKIHWILSKIKIKFYL